MKKQLENPNARIIITTIQKLTCFIKQNKEHPVYNQHIVIIFDECHRSQFGEMHQTITKAFKKYHLFGFTGTPIFAVNAGVSKTPTLRTTARRYLLKMLIQVANPTLKQQRSYLVSSCILIQLLMQLPIKMFCRFVLITSVR